jgi:hypothetical protein
MPFSRDKTSILLPKYFEGQSDELVFVFVSRLEDTLIEVTPCPQDLRLPNNIHSKVSPPLCLTLSHSLQKLPTFHPSLLERSIHAIESRAGTFTFAHGPVEVSISMSIDYSSQRTQFTHGDPRMKLLPHLSIQPLISVEGKEAILMQKIICLMGKGVEQCMFELCDAMGHGVEELETSRYSWMLRPGKIKSSSSKLQESWDKIPRKMVTDNPDRSRSSALLLLHSPLLSAFS